MGNDSFFFAHWEMDHVKSETTIQDASFEDEPAAPQIRCTPSDRALPLSPLLNRNLANLTHLTGNGVPFSKGF